MTELKPIVTIISSNGKHGLFDLDHQTKYAHNTYYKAFAFPHLKKLETAIIKELAKKLSEHGEGIEIHPVEIEVLEWPSHPSGKGRWMKR